MSRLHITDSPEWNRFFWALMVICVAVLLSNLFGCAKDTIEIEIIAEPGEETNMPKRIDWLLSYWYYAAIAVMIWAFYMAIRPKTPTHHEH